MQKVWSAVLEHTVPSPQNTYRPYLLRKSWLVFFLTVILTTEGAFVASLMAGQSAQTQPAAVVPTEVITFTNVERARENDSLLRENSLLDVAAQAKAEDMAQKGYFAHTGPDGKEPWRWIEEARYAYQYAGENLAVRFDDSANVVNAWMASPTHRDNIVKDVYTDIGVGVADGIYQGTPATFVVQYFGTPATAAVSAVSAPTPPGASTQTTSGAEVAGAQTAIAAAPQANGDSIVRQAAQAVSESSESTSWILGSVILLVLLLLSLAFFIHLEIQSHEMLIGGALVIGVAALFLGLNVHLPQASSGVHNQSAAVVQIRHSVLVGEEAAAVAVPSSASVPQQTPPTELSE